MFETIDQNILIVVLCFIAADVVTGLIKGAATHHLKSMIMSGGLWKKLGSVCLVFVGAGISIACEYVNFLPEASSLAFGGIAAYICAMETLSILENVLAINPDLDRYSIFKIFGVDPNESEDKDETEYKSFMEEYAQKSGEIVIEEIEGSDI